ncbi:HEAT repeat domain-containing protein [Thermodesulfovibrio sp.]|uniref:HEAT repeat domain-containing protein n=1 Tax=Thermodesulfovibrio sp. TaxID=2067987 RepID=UPI0030A78E22
MKKNLKRLAHKLLNDEDSSERRYAAEELSQYDERAIYPLIKALKDENTAVQEAATQSLITIGISEDDERFLTNPGELVTYMVIPLLREEEAFIRNTALLILTEIGSKAPHLIYQLLKDKDPDVRKFGLDLIADIKEGFDGSMIIPLLKDVNANVRAAAARAIGELNYKEAIPYLVESLNDEEWVSFYVLQALAVLQAEEAADAIGELLLASDSILVKAEAIETLGRIGTERVISPLLKYYPLATKDEKREIIKALIRVGALPKDTDIKEELLSILKEGDWEEKPLALRGIVLTNLTDAVSLIVEQAGALDPSCFDYDEKIGLLQDALLNINSEDELINLLERDKLKFRAKAFVISTLGKLRSKKAVPLLLKLLEDIKRDIRIASAKALGDIADAGSIKPLVTRSIEDPDTNVRKSAIEALGMIRAQDAFEPLLSLLEREEYPDVIETIVTSLIEIDQERFLSNIKSYRTEVKQTLANITYSLDIIKMLLGCDNFEVRKSAIMALGRLGTEEAITKLLELIGSDNKEIKKTAISALGEAQFCSDILFECLNDEDPWIRYYAVKAMNKGCDPEILIEKLTPLLDDPFPPVVIAVVEALGSVGGSVVYELLSSKVNHPDREVREKIEEVLSRI